MADPRLTVLQYLLVTLADLHLMCALLPPWAPQGVIVAHRSMVKSLAAYDTLLLDIGLLVLLGLIMGAAQVGASPQSLLCVRASAHASSHDHCVWCL